MPLFIRKPLEGLLPLMPLPLRDDQEIDFDGIRRNVALLADAGIQGFIVFGSMGQMQNVSEAEFDHVCDVAVSEGHARGLAVVVGCTSVSGREAIRRARHADDSGADGAMMAVPYGLTLTPDWVVAFYEEVASAVSGDLSIMVYNYPPLTGVNITPQMWSEHLLQIPSIRAIKESNTMLAHLDEVLLTIANKVNVFAGNDPAIWHASMLGAVGSTGIFCWAGLRTARRFVDMCRAGQQRDPWTMRAFRALQRASAAMRLADAPLISYEHGYLNAVVELGGGHAGAPRHPYRALPTGALARFLKAHDELRQLESELEPVAAGIA